MLYRRKRPNSYYSYELNECVYSVWVGGRHQKYFRQLVADLAPWLEFKKQLNKK